MRKVCEGLLVLNNTKKVDLNDVVTAVRPLTAATRGRWQNMCSHLNMKHSWRSSSHHTETLMSVGVGRVPGQDEWPPPPLVLLIKKCTGFPLSMGTFSLYSLLTSSHWCLFILQLFYQAWIICVHADCHMGALMTLSCSCFCYEQP